MAKSPPLLEFSDLIAASNRAEQVKIGDGMVEVRALTSSEETFVTGLVENVLPPALTRPVLPTDDKGKTVATADAYQETYDRDWSDPTYLIAKQAAEREAALWTTYFGTPTLRAGAEGFGTDDAARVKKLGEKLGQNVVDRLSTAITILTRYNDQAVTDFFSDGGSSYFQNSGNSMSANAADPSTPTVTTPSDSTSTAEPTTSIETSKLADSGDTA